ncbi:MAG: hypothetical protein Q9217_006229 [Psora testacea]
MSALRDVHTQLAFTPPVPNADFSGKTIIVTGANVGLGKEALKHFVRLNAHKVILAVRSVKKGEAAKAEIEAEEGCMSIVEVYELDYSSYASVKAFAANIANLPRVDVAVLNAGIATEKFEVFEDNESTITVNVISTALLTLLLLPILRSSASKYHIEPVITVVGSGVHAYTKFPERKTSNSLAILNNEKTAIMKDRYQVSKLLQLFAVRSIASAISRNSPFIILNTVNPGLCYTDLTRNAAGSTYYLMKVMRALLAWTAEEGSRTLVHAVTTGKESHGVFISMCRVKK